MAYIAINSLITTIPPPPDCAVKAVVTLSWPFSSSTRQCALLLADPDFRLRNKRGQIRVRFTGQTAEEVAKSRLGIGDEVVLGLSGGRWLKESSLINTPGKSVENELVFERKLELRFTRGGDEVTVNVDATASPKKSQQGDHFFLTPVSKPVVSLRTGERPRWGPHDDISPVYSSPAFARRNRLSDQLLLHARFDPFADEAQYDLPRKKQRTSFGGTRNWRYNDGPPSPVRDAEDELSVQEDQNNLGLDGAHELDDEPVPDTTSFTAPGEATVWRVDQDLPSSPLEASPQLVTHSQILGETPSEQTPPDTPTRPPLHSRRQHEVSSIAEAPLEMPPPPLPRLRMPSPQFPEVVRDGTEETESPLTPKLLPVSATTLPMPSPFPTEFTQAPLFPEPKIHDAEVGADVIAPQPVPDHASVTVIPEVTEASTRALAQPEARDTGSADDAALSSPTMLRSPNSHTRELSGDGHYAEGMRLSQINHDAIGEDVDMDEDAKQETRSSALTLQDGDLGEYTPLQQRAKVIDLIGSSSPLEEDIHSPYMEEMLKSMPSALPAPKQVHEAGLSVAPLASPPTSTLIEKRESERAAQRELILANTYRSIFGYSTRQDDGVPVSDEAQKQGINPWMSEQEMEALASIVDREMPFRTSSPVHPKDITSARGDSKRERRVSVNSFASSEGSDHAQQASQGVRKEHVREPDSSQERNMRSKQQHQPPTTASSMLESATSVMEQSALRSPVYIDFDKPKVASSTDVVDLVSSSDDDGDEHTEDLSAQIGSMKNDASVGTLTSQAAEEAQEFRDAPDVLMEQNISEPNPFVDGLPDEMSINEPDESTISIGSTLPVQSMDFNNRSTLAPYHENDDTYSARSTTQPRSPSQSSATSRPVPAEREVSEETKSNILSSSFVQLSSSPVQRSSTFHDLGDDVETLDLSQGVFRHHEHEKDLRDLSGVPDSNNSHQTTLVAESSWHSTKNDSYTQSQTRQDVSMSDTEDNNEEGDNVPHVHSDLGLIAEAQSSLDSQAPHTEPSIIERKSVSPSPSADILVSSQIDQQVIKDESRSFKQAIESPVELVQIGLKPDTEAAAETEAAVKTFETRDVEEEDDAAATPPAGVSLDQQPTLDLCSPANIETELPEMTDVTDSRLPMSPINWQSRHGGTLKNQAKFEVVNNFKTTLPLTPQLTQGQSSNKSLEKMAESKDQALPTAYVEAKTPSRYSLRSRLSNVPEVISAWFTPKRKAASQEDEVSQPDPEPKPSLESPSRSVHKYQTRSSGYNTSNAYFTPLSGLEQYINPSQGSGSNKIDVLVLVTDSTKLPSRAKSGPRDYFTIFRVTDASLPTGDSTRVEVFRPWRAVLPVAEAGDAVLLRAFTVKSRRRQPYLLSTDESAWCVWRFEKTKISEEDSTKPIWARKASDTTVEAAREEIKGPPVEFGDEEREHARRLHKWWRGERETGIEDISNTA